MEIWQAIVLGAVQGFTEFLPVSSSGHLLLLQNWFGINENALFYAVMLHIGTLIPVIVVLWKQIMGLFQNKWRRFLLLVLATIPAGLVGLLLNNRLDVIFADNMWLLSVTFLLTAVELFYSEYRAKRVSLSEDINVKTSLIMGAGQALGVVTGLSRSGTTLAFGTIAKVKGEENAAWTFLMSIPIILAAAFLTTLDIIKDGSIGSINVGALILGVVTSALTGYIAVKFMLKIVRKANYKWFSLYLVIISLVNLIVYLV